MTKSGIPPSWAYATPVTRLVAPGPSVDIATPARPVRRPTVAAIKTAVCSSRVVINLIFDLRTASRKARFSSPGSPKMYFTPAAPKLLAKRSDAFITDQYIFPIGRCYHGPMTQAEALAILKTGVNVFLTGEPGSGKTHTVNVYVQYLRERGVQPAITASTGLAATHIGGYTIHSWSGIGLKKNMSDYDIELLMSKEKTAKRIINAKVLIVD